MLRLESTMQSTYQLLLPFGNTAALQIDTDSPEKLLKLIAIKTKTRDQKMFSLRETEKRLFSLSSSPTKKKIFEFTQKMTGNDFSVALDHLKKGDWVMLDGPFGSFTFVGEFPKVVMLAGGVGVTPYRSMINYCTNKKADTDIVLLYSNRTESDILFKREFDQVSDQHPNIRIVYTLTEVNTPWTGYSRRIDKKMIIEEIPDFNKSVFPM